MSLRASLPSWTVSLPRPQPSKRKLGINAQRRPKRSSCNWRAQAAMTYGQGVTATARNWYGEAQWLLTRAEQPDGRLPSETLSVQVPQPNTPGGFEMFSHRVADLAPELFGFYGAPGITAD